MSDDWLNQIRQLYEADKAKQQDAAEQQQQAENQEQQRKDQAIALLRNSKAHELLRQVQKALLNGEGTLEVYDSPRKYERAIVLAWQGSFANARRVDPKDPGDYYYILVGVREGSLWVNKQLLKSNKPEALQQALVAACKNPAVQKRKSSHES